MTSSQFENKALGYLRDISQSARQAGDALVEIGKMIKEYVGTEVDLDAMRANIEKLNELARLMEASQPTAQGQYAADADGKMKVHEWMHNLNVHYELVDPDMSFGSKQYTKDEFWEYIELLDTKGLVRKVVKDANQLELPQLIEGLGVTKADLPRFELDDTVQIIDKTDENYLRTAVIKAIDGASQRAFVEFGISSEGVPDGTFHVLQLAHLPTAAKAAASMEKLAEEIRKES
jgi:hypothetical protein